METTSVPISEFRTVSWRPPLEFDSIFSVYREYCKKAMKVFLANWKRDWYTMNVCRREPVWNGLPAFWEI